MNVCWPVRTRLRPVIWFGLFQAALMLESLR